MISCNNRSGSDMRLRAYGRGVYLLDIVLDLWATGRLADYVLFEDFDNIKSFYMIFCSRLYFDLSTEGAFKGCYDVVFLAMKKFGNFRVDL